MGRVSYRAVALLGGGKKPKLEKVFRDAGGGGRRLHAPLPHPTFRGMFDVIRGELTTGADKLVHLRRFL